MGVGSANNFLKSVLNFVDTEDCGIVLELEADGAVHRPGRDDSLLLLDGRQLGERCPGQVLEKREPHAGGLPVPTPGVVGGGGVGSEGLPG